MAKTLTRTGNSGGLGVDAAVARQLLGDMFLIRRFEEKAAEAYALGKIGGFLHLYIGEEAVAAGAASALRPDDYAISAYREHGHCLAKGADPRRAMAELFGRRDGLSKGKGGSMHLFDKSRNFLGGHGIVGAHLPLAAGVGFAIKYQGGDQVVLCYFGDGAVPEGEFHESLNLCALWKLPVVYICENNRYAMGTAIHRARSEEHTSELQSHLNLVCRLLLEKNRRQHHRGRRQRSAQIQTPKISSGTRPHCRLRFRQGLERRPPLQPRLLFFFNDTATTEIYTLSLHDALPISRRSCSSRVRRRIRSSSSWSARTRNSASP